MSTIDADLDRIEKAQAEPEMGDLLVAYLNELGVEYVFGLPGGAIEPLYNALARSEHQGGCEPQWPAMRPAQYIKKSWLQ